MPLPVLMPFTVWLSINNQPINHKANLISDTSVFTKTTNVIFTVRVVQGIAK